MDACSGQVDDGEGESEEAGHNVVFLRPGDADDQHSVHVDKEGIYGYRVDGFPAVAIGDVAVPFGRHFEGQPDAIRRTGVGESGENQRGDPLGKRSKASYVVL